MLRCLFYRLRGAFAMRSAGIIRMNYSGKQALCLYLLVALAIYLRFLRGLHIFTSYEELYRTAARKLEEEAPKVSELDCRIFMNAKNSWNKTLDGLSKTQVKEKIVYKGSCEFTQSTLWQVPASRLEQNFPIAYSVMVYRDFDRFVRLLRAIYRHHNVYCIHVDQNSDKEFQSQVTTFVGCFSNVFQPSDPVHVQWGLSSVLEAELVCMRALWNHPIRWKALINLTGQEFPLKTNLELVNILQVMAGQNDVWIDPCTYDGPGDYQDELCQSITPEGFRDRWKKIEAPPFKVTPYKGQVHVVLFRAAVDFILHSFVSRVFLEWVNKTNIPDELYFSSLNSNPHVGIPGGNKNPMAHKPSISRFKLWWNRHKHIVKSCDNYVRNICQLTPRELSAMTTSKQLFANKFKVDLKPAGYSCLEEWFYQRVLMELKTNRIQLDLTYYRKLFAQE
ncbi:beta-1,3-galactosyl-O-glycosyl-glycoprotein beta-1,6-N-acetylglucosaminyltransferase [Biomphalaria glabrata]|nr:beta-1,3-galactosyl-O-glycosyl-glycoprotein beta-1,6-N-acetylglucosaminyltransferase [Biomphalaria glabrata]